MDQGPHVALYPGPHCWLKSAGVVFVDGGQVMALSPVVFPHATDRVRFSVVVHVSSSLLFKCSTQAFINNK